MDWIGINKLFRFFFLVTHGIREVCLYSIAVWPVTYFKTSDQTDACKKSTPKRITSGRYNKMVYSVSICKQLCKL